MNSHQRKQAQKAYLSNLNKPTQDLATFQRMVALAGQFNADAQELEISNEWAAAVTVGLFESV